MAKKIKDMYKLKERQTIKAINLNAKSKLDTGLSENQRLKAEMSKKKNNSNKAEEDTSPLIKDTNLENGSNTEEKI